MGIRHKTNVNCLFVLEKSIKLIMWQKVMQGKESPGLQQLHRPLTFQRVAKKKKKRDLERLISLKLSSHPQSSQSAPISLRRAACATVHRQNAHRRHRRRQAAGDFHRAADEEKGKKGREAASTLLMETRFHLARALREERRSLWR